MLQKGAMDDTATTDEGSDLDDVGPRFWIVSTPPWAVAALSRIGFRVLGADLRRLADRACPHLAGLPSLDIVEGLLSVDPRGIRQDCLRNGSPLSLRGRQRSDGRARAA